MEEQANGKVALTHSSLDEVILDLYNQIDIIMNDLNEIKNKFDDITIHFKGEVSDAFQAKFSSFSSKYNIIKSNLNAYAEDLKIIKRVYKNIDENAANDLRKIAQQLQDDVAKINTYQDIDVTIK